MDLERLFLGKAPSLYVLKEAFTRNIAESWLAIQIRDLSEFAGCRDKMSLAQIEQTAKTIMLTFGYLKVTELMYFFILFKSGRFGHFYGAVDGMVITEALREFMKIRSLEIDRIEKERRERQKAREQKEQEGRLMTYQEWEELRWLFNMGYEPERIRKELEQQNSRINYKEEQK